MATLDSYFPKTDDAVQATARATFSETALGMAASRILVIAYAVKDRIAAGEEVANFTVGDFAPGQFTVPAPLAEGIHKAVDEGHTNYPPADGVLELRQAIRDHYHAVLGLDYPVSSVVVGSGARPVLFAAYQCLINPGEKVICPGPGWNNNNFCQLVGAEQVVVSSRPEDAFMPTAEGLAPHLKDARLLVLCSPMNPAGTMMTEGQLADICDLIIEENRRREAAGERLLYVIYDQVYRMLTYGDRVHHTPVGLRPEMAKYTMFSDAISKCYAATGLRVGWMVGPPMITAKVKALMTHMGAWAPRPEQMATARLLAEPAIVEDYMTDFKAELRGRLDMIADAIKGWQAAGHPVQCIDPQGAFYLSVKFDLVGRPGFPDEDAVVAWLLEHGCAVVPFSAFGYQGDETGWVRFSVGAVSRAQIERCVTRLGSALASI
ncbi:MAG: pyridoxal phosphate-dependent aminotransferase [Bradymonadia bacterium]